MRPDIRHCIESACKYGQPISDSFDIEKAKNRLLDTLFVGDFVYLFDNRHKVKSIIDYLHKNGVSFTYVKC